MTRKNQKSWFTPVGRLNRADPLSALWVEIEDGSRANKKLIVTVPGTCGTAVQRNRFRRIVRAYFSTLSEESLGPKRALWIRLQRKFRFPQTQRLKQWQAIFENLQSKLE